MSYEHKEGSGSLFKNDRKAHDAQPDYKGDAMIDGKQVWLSAWIKQGAKGKFMSLSIQPKDAAHKQGMADAKQAAAPAPQADTFTDDDLPF